MSLRLIRNFINGVDKATAANLSRQLSQLEDNVRDETESIRAEFAERIEVVAREYGADGLALRPGQAAGIDTTAADRYVLLEKPSPADEGRLSFFWAPTSINHIIIEAAKGSLINKVNQVTISMATRNTIYVFCDGQNYWVD